MDDSPVVSSEMHNWVINCITYPARQSAYLIVALIQDLYFYFKRLGILERLNICSKKTKASNFNFPCKRINVLIIACFYSNCHLMPEKFPDRFSPN